MSNHDRPGRWDQISRLFAQALEVPAGERESFLRADCSGDVDLAQAVRDLLSADRVAEDQGFLVPPVSPSPAQPPDGEPLRFGDYQIGTLLGSGAFGMVYQARQVSLNRQVALKLIRLGDLADRDDIRRFRLEAETVATMDHPNIVPLYEVGEHDGQHYFSMKLIPGGNLASRRADFLHRPNEAALLVAEVADGVDHAHRRGVLHRDLKPANILLDESSRPIVTDFGLARRLGAAGTSRSGGGAVGTPEYMSPEQVRGPREAITTATDLYGLGAILYELLTGRPPFQAEGEFEVLRRVVEDDPAPPRRIAPGVSRDLDAICLKCLDKDPLRRYTSAAELASDLRSAARGEPVSVRRPGPRARARRLIRTHPKLVRAALILAVALPVAGVIGRLLERDEQARQERQGLEIQAMVREASLDMEQGRWSSAVGRLEQAIQAGYAQPAHLRIQQARALFVLNREDVARTLEKARTGPDAREVEGDRLLWEGDLLMGRDTPAAVQTIQNALRVGISRPADRHYAQGLIAKKPAEARRFFALALDQEKIHPRATSMLILTDVFLGDRPAARNRLILARGVFAEDPGLALIDAALLALDGKMDDARRRLTEAKFLEDRENAEQFVRALDELNRDTDRLAPELAAIRGRVAKFTPTMLERVSRTGLIVPACFQEGLTDLIAKVTTSALPILLGTQERLARLDAQYRDSPDGMIQFTAGMLLMGAKDNGRAEAFFLRAADLPALIRLERPALYAALNCQAWAIRMDPRRTPESIAAASKRAGQTAHRLWQTGPLPEVWCSTFAHTARIANQTDLASTATDYWETLGGPRLDIALLRAQTHYNAGRYARAIEKAREILRNEPKEGIALDLIQRCQRLYNDEQRRIEPLR